MKGLSPTLGSSPGVLRREDESTESLALKVSGDCIGESQRAEGKTDSALKGHKQNLTGS